MKEDFTKFVFKDKLGYKGIAGAKQDPVYTKQPIDYDLLLKLLDGDGIVDYDYKKLLSSKVIEVKGEFDGLHYSPPRTIKIDNLPTVNIGGLEITLNVSALVNTKKGKINRDDDNSLSVIIDLEHETDKFIYYIKYSNHEDLKGDNKYALIITTSDFDDFLYIQKRARHFLINSNEDFIYRIFDNAFESAGKNRNKLDFLYEQAPLWVISRRGPYIVCADLKLILQGNVNQFGTDEEKAVINILKSFLHPKTSIVRNDNDSSFKPDGGLILSRLITERISDDKDSDLLFHVLYKKINNFGGNDNFDLFIKVMYILWLNSTYPTADLDEEKNGISDVIIINYKSTKMLGFLNSSFSFEFDGVYISIKKEEFVRETYNMAEKTIDDAIFKTVQIARPHLYQSINVPVKQENDELKQPQNIIPAFFLKAIADKNLWDNIEKASWLSLDIITTVTGFGNLLKLRHLTHLSKTLKFIKTGLGIIEVSSGTTGVLLNFINECDSENSTCDTIRTFLIYIDLAILGVDGITSALLRKSAREVIDTGIPALLSKNHPEVLLYLNKFARVSENEVDLLKISKESKTDELFRKIKERFDNITGKKILTHYDIKKLRRLLKDFGVDLQVVDKNPKFKEKWKKWSDPTNRRKVLGSFDPKSRIMFITSKVTEYTVEHEMMHMKLWYKMNVEFPELENLYSKISIRVHEEYVLSELLKSSKKLDESDILLDLDNVNIFRELEDLDKVNLDYFKNWQLTDHID